MVYRFVFVSHCCSLHKSSGAWKNEKLRTPTYNTQVRNIFRKRASKLISADIYMCELKRFFSFYPAAYLATKFLILMEFAVGRSAPKAILNFYATFFKLGLLL